MFSMPDALAFVAACATVIAAIVAGVLAFGPKRESINPADVQRLQKHVDALYQKLDATNQLMNSRMSEMDRINSELRTTVALLKQQLEQFGELIKQR